MPKTLRVFICTWPMVFPVCCKEHRAERCVPRSKITPQCKKVDDLNIVKIYQTAPFSSRHIASPTSPNHQQWPSECHRMHEKPLEMSLPFQMAWALTMPSSLEMAHVMAMPSLLDRAHTMEMPSMERSHTMEPLLLERAAESLSSRLI